MKNFLYRHKKWVKQCLEKAHDFLIQRQPLLEKTGGGGNGHRESVIVGSGLMGSGIARVCAQVGIQVFMNDISQEILNKGLKNISWSVGKFVEKGKLKERLETIMGRIRTSTDLAAAPQADLAIEAVFEKLELKQEIFKKLDEICAPRALLASNTSAVPITELATVTRHPERVLGLHFFSPAPMMEVVEIVIGWKQKGKVLGRAQGET